MTHFLTSVFYANAEFSDPDSIETLARWALTSTNVAGHQGGSALKPTLLVASATAHCKGGSALGAEELDLAGIREPISGRTEAAEGSSKKTRRAIDRANPAVLIDIEMRTPPIAGALAQLSDVGWISPNSDDTLFWCVYLASQGDTSRLTPKTVAKEKSAIIDHIRAFPKCLKASSEKTPLVATNDILFTFLTQPATPPESLVALCVYYKIRVMMIHVVGKVDGVAYAEVDPILEGSDYPVFIIQMSPSTGKYAIDLDTTEAKLSVIRETGVRLESMSRPLKSVSSYRVAELASMAGRVGLLFDKKSAKSVMYGALVDTCKWPIVVLPTTAERRQR
jgi:hypothetical protein